MDQIQVTFLEMGGQEPEAVARQLAAFLAQATQSLDCAVYDFHLTGPPRAIVVAALQERMAQGVQVRCVYDSDTPDEEIRAAGAQGAPRPPNATAAFLHALGLPAHAVTDPCCLMHHKYIVRDAGTPAAQVWTGSTNFSDDSWTLQENNILVLASPAVAAGYAQDFQELWTRRTMANTGRRDVEGVALTYAGAPAPVEVHFSPGQGPWLNDHIAARVQAAQTRLTIGAAVLTSGRILRALESVMDRGLPITGLYDQTQMAEVRTQWQRVPTNHWKIPLLDRLVAYGPLVGKVTTPWTPTSRHDFMHNKILVVDDTVITGSYNFSRSAESNAENVVMITSPALAGDYRAYLSHLAQRYARSI